MRKNYWESNTAYLKVSLENELIVVDTNLIGLKLLSCESREGYKYALYKDWIEPIIYLVKIYYNLSENKIMIERVKEIEENNENLRKIFELFR